MSESMGWEYVYTRVMSNPFGKLVAANYIDTVRPRHSMREARTPKARAEHSLARPRSTRPRALPATSRSPAFPRANPLIK